MNQTISQPTHGLPYDLPTSPGPQSRLRRLGKRLLRRMNRSRAKPGKSAAYRGYIEENLLDARMGPEISRTLRV